MSIIVEKFWNRVDMNGPIHPVHGQCRQWTGRRHKNGYGRMPNGELAHRVSWFLLRDASPNHLSVLHHCDNRLCVNPSHLFLGTQQDNLADMRIKGRQVRGEQQGSAVLTSEQVEYIRERYKRYSHEDGSGAIARELGVSTVQVWKIVKRLHWRHI